MATIQNLNHTLSGRITDRQGKPLTGLTVRAYDQDPKSHDDFLGEAVTNEAGRYTIRFSEAQFKPHSQEPGVEERMRHGGSNINMSNKVSC